MAILNSDSYTVVVSDLHSGCRMALYPYKSKLKLDCGIKYKPSKTQKFIYECWKEFWDSWIPSMIGKAPFKLVVNGDIIDGSHHGTTTQISNNLSDQKKIAYELLAPVVDKLKDDLYIIRGTEAHVGQSGVAEEELAELLGAKKDKLGQYSRYELFLRTGGLLSHFSHHIGTVSSAQSETNSLMQEVTEFYVDSAKWGDEPPACLVRSHRHRHASATVATKYGNTICVTTPSWQAKTPFVHRLKSGRANRPQFGGILLYPTDLGMFFDSKVWTIGRPEVEE